jgi:hypothetical protein
MDVKSNKIFQSILSLSFLFLVACGGSGGGGDPVPEPDSNNAPVANNDAAEVAFQESVNIDVLSNDTDADGDSLSIVSVTQPSSGTATVENGEISFQSADESGEISFSYVISDGEVNSTIATVIVTVLENVAAVAIEDLATTPLNSSVTIDALENDTDAEGHSLTLALVTEPSEGTVAIVDNKFVYTSGNSTGDFEFQYMANDGFSDSNTSSVTVTVTPLILTLNGRVYPPVENVNISADIIKSGDDTTVVTATDKDGLFSLSVPVEVMSDFISLTATIDGELLYYRSYVGSTGKLIGMADSQNSIDYSSYPQLEMTPLSTAISTYMKLRDEDGVIASDAEMEKQLELADGFFAVKLAVTLDEFIKGTATLPDNLTSIPDFIVSENVFTSTIFQQGDEDVSLYLDDLVENMSQLNSSESFVSGFNFAFATEKNQYKGSAYGMVFDKKDSGATDLYSRVVVRNPHIGFGYIPFDSEMAWSLNEQNHLVIQSNIPNDIMLTFENRFIYECQITTNAYITLNEVKFTPIYIGENVDQFIIKYSGATTAGENFSTPCEGLTSTSWSSYQIVNIKKSTTPLSESLATSKFAVSIGRYLDAVGTSYSASLIEMYDDGSARIELDNSLGSWSFDTQGALDMVLGDGSTVKYKAIGERHNKIYYLAYKVLANGDKEMFSGTLVVRDPSFSLDSIVGRYELAPELGEEANYALSFQENGLGQVERKSVDGEWYRPTMWGFDLEYFRWSNGPTSFDFDANFSARDEDGGWTFSNQSINGCDIDDTSCAIWKKRNLNVIAQEGDYLYIMFNSTIDHSVFAFPGYKLNSGFIWTMKKTDFVLPPIE